MNRAMVSRIARESALRQENIDLQFLRAQLEALNVEATEYGISKAMRDRIGALRGVLDVVEAEREKRSA